MADDQSSIPSVVDGLKPGQRKILFCALKNPYFQNVKAFRGYVAEHSVYRDGEQDLVTTMTYMAQNYVGTNNVILLYPLGRGNSRYIHTKLASITRYLFHKSDEPLLNYLIEDGKSIEPTWFMPIIPMVLVNGIEGIGTNYNPSDIIANIRRLLNGEELVPMDPWYQWFKGTILRITTTHYATFGVVKEKKRVPNRLFITELPIGKSVGEYEEFLKAAAFIEGYDAYYNYDGTATFEVVMSPDQMNKAREEGFVNKFELTTTLNTNNMYLLDANGKKKKYDTPEEILEEFFLLRLKYYEKRKAALLNVVDKALLELENQVRFFNEFRERTINLDDGKKREELYDELKVKGYPALPKEAVSEPSTENDYHYLTSMISSMDIDDEYENQVRAEYFSKISELDMLTYSSPKDLWLQDLDALEVQLKKLDKDDVQRRLKWIPVTDSEIEEIKPYEVVSDSEIEKEQEEIEKEQKSSEMSDPEISSDEDPPEISSDEDPPEISSDSETKEEEASKVSDPMIEEEESSQFDSGSDIRSSLEDVVSLEQDKEDEAGRWKKWKKIRTI